MKQLGDADPRRIGPYTLLGRLGAGGMGAVYLGRSAGGRTVAVKVVRLELAEDGAFRDRFRHEVVAARRVSGGFTAAVVDADVEAAVPWMATTFVPGVALDKAVRERGPLPERTLWTLTAGVAEALVSVHEAGLIHRDLKPANVLLALDGPHVIDFGIARAVDGTALTSTGAVIGSAPYMSPEQAVGSPLTEASDVFSLASTIAHAARGDSLFGDGAAAAVLFRIVHTEPDLARLPAGLRELLASCLTQDPAARPRPREICDAVERAGAPLTSASWLPDEVAGDVVALRSVMTALPAPEPDAATDPPTVLLGRPSKETGPSPVADRRGPSRRLLLLGAAGGALATGGLGAWFALGDDGSHGSGKSGAGREIRRPAADGVREATLAWKVKSAEPCPQVLCAKDLVLGVSLRQVLALDGDGKEKWSVNPADPQTTFALSGTMPKTVAALDGDRLYVGGMSVTLAGAGPAVTAVDLTEAESLWTTKIDREHTSGVHALAGVRDGKVYTVGFGDGRKGGSAFSGAHVWCLNTADRKTAWFHGEKDHVLWSALPSGSGTVVLAGTERTAALDARGEVDWSEKARSHSVFAFGPHFVHSTTDGRTTLRDTAGKKLWSTTGLVASARGDGMATGEKETVLYVLRADDDGGATVRALDRDSGKASWQAPLPAVRKDGKLGSARLLHSDGNLYSMDGDGVVWAFDSADGKPRWKYSGFRGTDPLKLVWHAAHGRLALCDPTATTIAVLHANGA
ncbi:serine/threonine-protein kinase [Streptomyces sp. P38-E01]|uniref:Serine/threonine-protein kinase n=1 Tax=Streptomyces tardus TaxID=2780544 RepID=A0A949JIS8_9ACTN|nr:serine/threonine-protein kinase [Streptomyces tardus]MBU7599415.1 serine/threonine-protein kinase [Streptomyces tardus]